MISQISRNPENSEIFFSKISSNTIQLVSVGQTYNVSKHISARHLFCIYDFQGKMQEELQDSSVVMQEWVIKTLQIKQDKIQLYVLSSETVDFLGKNIFVSNEVSVAKKQL